jgi:alkylation response protein AidB-like acyl-CoA dehydrogenase
MSIAELRPPAGPDKIPTADELIYRARALAPKLRERVLKAERDRNLPPETVEEYIDAGLIHTLQPKRWGGYEHDHEVAFDIAIELGKSTCTSSAWVLNYFTDHACILALFPEEAQHDVWSQTKRPASPPRRRLPGKFPWYLAAIASTDAGRGAAVCVTRSGS